ncbi:hypothetical protein PSN13_06509 [Micromonospora saelicesensis]|uniref:Scaffolding protein n=1 Tax=Micromonospora saelicesensis TaxID=285676 RepID=A0A328NIK9_9ACTN|nr:hypothetical protein [Micromonospora saelicesensis]RAO26481.1 hypothetical protein PSN13_06509 [Micromonospora saelicesensis]
MADTTEATERVASENPTTDNPEAGGERPQDVPPEVKRALSKANKEAETLRLKLKEYEDRDKSEAEKTAERLTAAEQRAAEAELRATRLEVAHEKGLTPAQAKRLVGATREELAADADEILRDFPTTPAAPERKVPKPDPSQGSRGGAKPSSAERANSRLERLGIRKPAST